ncbi:MAG: hypothetical protein ABIH41_03400 [Nanoarchaeota archaeon]
MKKTYPVTKYYKNNNRLVKVQGSLLLILGLVIFVGLIYAIYAFNNYVSSTAEYLSSDNYDSGSDYYDYHQQTPEDMKQESELDCQKTCQTDFGTTDYRLQFDLDTLRGECFCYGLTGEYLGGTDIWWE